MNYSAVSSMNVCGAILTLYPDPSDDEAAFAEGWVYSDPGLAANRAAECVVQGFTAVKFDPARPCTVYSPRQPELVAMDRSELFAKRIREAVGSKAYMLCGTHGQFSTSGAIQFAQRLEGDDPLWFEEPTSPDITEEMAVMARQTSIPIATGKRLTTKHEFVRVPKVQAASILKRHPGSQEHRWHDRSALCPDRPASLLQTDRQRHEYPVGNLHAETPDPREQPTLGGFPQCGPEITYSVGRWARHPGDYTGA